MFLNDDTLFLSLRNIIRKMHRLGDREMTRYGMSHAEMRLLLLLFEEDGRSQEYLVSKHAVDRTSVGRSLKRLESLGFVTRAKNPEDGRANLVFLTERGRESRETVLTIKEDIERKATAGVTPEELRLLSRLLQKMDGGFLDTL